VFARTILGVVPKRRHHTQREDDHERASEHNAAEGEQDQEGFG
jgi:hypothetical protein